MKPRLQTSLGQHLVLTPQLRQAIHLLQLPGVELEAEIAAQVEANPLLEWVDDDDPFPPPTGMPVDAAGIDQAPASQVETLSETDWADPGDFAWEQVGSGHGEDATAQLADSDTLQDHLLWQLHMAHCSARDRMVAVALIESIDEHGYLREALQDVASNLPDGTTADDDELCRNLALVQSMDPAGVGARDLAECLRLQLQRLSADTPGHALALRIADTALEQLPRAGVPGLSRSLGADPGQVEQALHLLRSLDPRPGARHGAIPHDTFVTPDCVVWRQQGVWKSALVRNPLARLGIQRSYEQLAASTSGEDGRYLRGQLQEARWLLKNLESRGQTLLRVVDCLLREQSAFLEFGPRALRPLTLREVATQLELHESTISRAVARKYVHTPRGTLPLRDFFASGVGSNDGGGETSSTAIQDMIRSLVAEENPRKPLSDAHLANALQARGIQVARRTVAKYREAIGIESSQQRMRLG